MYVRVSQWVVHRWTEDQNEFVHSLLDGRSTLENNLPVSIPKCDEIPPATIDQSNQIVEDANEWMIQQYCSVGGCRDDVCGPIQCSMLLLSFCLFVDLLASLSLLLRLAVFARTTGAE